MYEDNMLRLRTKDLFGDYDQLGYAVEAGYVIEKDHPFYEGLSLYVYDNNCVFDHVWTPVTKQARGLIVGPDWVIVALPFPKSFLVEVHTGGAVYAPPLPTGPFTVTTKVDGSLAIIYWWDEKWRVATKGSFFSDHAVWGQAYLDEKDTGGLDRSLTYLAEMIIPDWGRIVVDNGDQADMVLLGARSLYTGDYQRIETLVEGWRSIGSVVKSWGLEIDPVVLSDRIKSNHRPDDSPAKGVEFEGVVLQWGDGTMAKAKMADYINLHSLFTETTELGIWRILSSGGEIESIMDKAPDEMVDWIKSVMVDLEAKKGDALEEVFRAFMKTMKLARESVFPLYPERRDFAKFAMQSPYRGTLFLVYDEDDEKLETWAWKQVRPTGKTTFRKVEEEAEA